MSATASLKELNKLIFKDRLQVADAVVWLQGDRLDRGLKVLELFKRGWAKKIIISGNNARIGKIRPGEDNIRLEEMVAWLGRRGIKPKDIAVDRRAFNTRDQAANIIKLAKKRNWKSLIVVGSWPYYQFRVFLTFLKAARQQGWKGRIINRFVVIPKNRKPGGRQKSAAALQKLEEKKLKKYKSDIAGIARGIAYLKGKNPQLSLKKAKISDAKFLWLLRNDAEVRKNSFNRDRIKFADHLAWLKKVLKDNGRFLYILLDARKRPIGQIRFDKKGNKAEISIALHRTARHKGYGVPAIQIASEYFLKPYNKSVNKIMASIRQDNIPSIQAFLRAGYRPGKKTGKIITLFYKGSSEQAPRN